MPEPIHPMDPKPDQQPLAPEPPRLDEAVPCDGCGRYGAYLMDGRKLCEDCCQGSGSCCCD